MFIKRIDKLDLLFIIVSIGTSLLVYSSLFGGFFQQDEWLGYARHILLSGSTPKELVTYAFTPGLGHYTPLNPLLVYLSFVIFGLNYHAHVLVSLVLHACVIFLFYSFSKFFFPKKLAFLATLLFGLTAASFQGTAWIVADLGTHMSSIFGLLSLILITKFLKLEDKKFLILSITTLIVSLLFKELTLGLFAILPIMILFWGKLLNKKQKIRYSSLILFIGFLYVAFRAIIIFNLSAPGDYTQQSNHTIYNLVTVPAKSISQTLVPVEILKKLSFGLTYLLFELGIVEDYGSPKFESFTINKTLEAVSLIFSIIFALLVLKVTKSKPEKKIVAFCLLFILLNSLVFALAPEKEGIISAIDSRNLYFISIGISLLITVILEKLLKKYFLHGFIVLLVFNAYFLNQLLSEFNNKGKIRREILNEVKKEYPALPHKAILYTESDVSFYGLSKNERILPFQSGFGQTLLAWYSTTQNFPKEFFENKFLWEIKDQGYKEVNDEGFGYFRDFNLMGNTVRNFKIPESSIFGFRYDSETKSIEDNTTELRGRIHGFLGNKKPVSSFFLESAHNSQNLYLAKDGDRKTLWSTDIPYSQPQYIEINLVTKTKIAQITIDSYNNKNQDEVGYAVFISENKTDWERIFHSKRYTPSQDGYVDLYFEPKNAKHIKIEQIGFHQFAHWVIHELNIYETN